jgi:hypothetical protein
VAWASCPCNHGLEARATSLDPVKGKPYPVLGLVVQRSVQATRVEVELHNRRIVAVGLLLVNDNPFKGMGGDGKCNSDIKIRLIVNGGHTIFAVFERTVVNAQAGSEAKFHQHAVEEIVP